MSDSDELLTREQRLEELLRVGASTLADARATIAYLDAQLELTRARLAESGQPDQLDRTDFHS